MNKEKLVALLSGIIFGIGLSISGMTDIKKVKGFLDIFGNWDGSLMFVLGGAVTVTFFLFPFITKRETSFFGNKLALPTKKELDVKLILGAIIFGIGWGLGGLCPGPAITNLSTGNPMIFVFVFFMIIGFLVNDKILNK
ncbi:MAG: DUF6691 family protein [Candidatus Sericytochromatia bacterium]